MGFHADASVDVSFENGSPVGEEHVYTFNDVDEDFVAFVSDALSTPRDCTCGTNGDLLEFFDVSKRLLLLTCPNVLFEKVCVKELRIAVVHDFIE